MISIMEFDIYRVVEDNPDQGWTYHAPDAPDNTGVAGLNRHTGDAETVRDVIPDGESARAGGPGRHPPTRV